MHPRRSSPHATSVLIRLCLGSVFAWVLGTPAAYGDKPYVASWKLVMSHERIDVEADGTTTTRREQRYTLLTEEAAREWAEQTISYHDNSGVLEDVVAYTLKGDGRRIDVPTTNVQVTSHDGIDGLPPAFSDLRDRRLIYPDVEPGDTVVLAYTLRDEKPSFPGHFSEITYFHEDVEVIDEQLIVTAPKAMNIRATSYGIPPAEVTDLPGERRQWHWKYKSAAPTTVPDEPAGYERVWRYQDSPTILISSFPDYAAIATAYLSRASVKAQVTDRIRELSATIAGDAGTPREKAKRLYDWVAKEVDFAGNCLANGDVVPRETDLILNLKMGDCKDHSTLLEAMLAAQGIVGNQVLIHSGSHYEIPEIPCWQAFNHVVNYLPDFDVYVDSTDRSQPFGSMSNAGLGKPVLHVSASPRLARTPPIPNDANWSKSTATINVLPDGSIDVKQTFETGGDLANSLRHTFDEARKSPDFGKGEEWIKRALVGYGYSGKGSYTHIDGARDRDVFSYSMSYKVDSLLDTENPYGVALTGFFPNPDGIRNLASVSAVEKVEFPFVCSGTKIEETLRYKFPDNVELLAVPHDVSVSVPLLKYHAKYSMNNNEVSVTRSLVDVSPAPVCEPSVHDQYRAIGLAIQKDTKAQAVYQPRK